MTSRFMMCNDREIHYLEWLPTTMDGSPNGLVVMWHGLSRQSFDFEVCGPAVAAAGFVVIAPDTVGRGLSQWASDPKTEYSFQFYCEIARALVSQVIDRYRLPSEIRWVGTSMGGLIGLKLLLAPTSASGVAALKISHIFLNDIGFEIPDAAIQRIMTYVPQPPIFDKLSELDIYYRRIYVPYGRLDEDAWQSFLHHGFRRKDNGQITAHYDPRITVNMDTDLDPFSKLYFSEFSKHSSKAFVLRGSDSDILTDIHYNQLLELGAEGAVVPGVGHTPQLRSESELTILLSFLISTRRITPLTTN